MYRVEMRYNGDYTVDTFSSMLELCEFCYSVGLMQDKLVIISIRQK